jgi:ribosome-associated toxin RatA of RatAB toxin-antitoxin module
LSALTGSCSAEIEFSIERCWALVADIERAPRWERMLVRVDVVERDDRGRAVVCDTVIDAKVTKVDCRVRMSYEEPVAVRWTMLESDHLDAMDGAWELEPLGAERTRATYSLTVDPGSMGFVARRLEKMLRPVVIGHQADELAEALAAGL